MAAQTMSAPNDPGKATLWMAGAIVAFSTLAIGGREVAPDLDTFELMMYRSFIGIALVVAIAAGAGTLGQITTRRFRLHVIRNAGHFLGQNFWFYAITVIPLAQAVAIEFTTPLWAALFAVVILGERISAFRGAMLAIGFCGILIVTRPWVEPPSVGVITAAVAAVGFAISAVYTRLLTRTETITTILFWLVVMQAVFGVVFAAYDGDVAWPSTAVWPWVGLVSISGLVAHFCLTRALSLAPAAVVMPVDFVRLPAVALIGVAAYGESLDVFVFVGAALIFGSNYLNIWREARSVPKM